MMLRKTVWAAWLPGILFAAAITTFGQSAPEVFKVDRPSWWTSSSVNPVRLLVQGKNLKGARVQIQGTGLRVVGSPKTNDRGTYLSVDVAIAPQARPGPRRLKITTPGGTAQAAFEVLSPMARDGRFQGFSPVRKPLCFRPTRMNC